MYNGNSCDSGFSNPPLTIFVFLYKILQQSYFIQISDKSIFEITKVQFCPTNDFLVETEPEIPRKSSKMKTGVIEF